MQVYKVIYNGYGYVDLICAKSEVNARIISNVMRPRYPIQMVYVCTGNYRIMLECDGQEGYQTDEYDSELDEIVNWQFHPVNTIEIKLRNFN